MTGHTVVVAIPACNEQEGVADCLQAVSRAVRHAAEAGVIDRAVVQVVAHRSSDATARIAADVIAIDLHGDVLAIEEQMAVGMIRDIAVRRGLRRIGGRLSWIFSTDADSVVTDDWITRTLVSTSAVTADCMVGLVRLDGWEGSAIARLRYQAIIDDKLYGTDSELDGHGHVYGANLAVRSDAYLAVGGFPHTGHGEDQRLVDALAAARYRILRTTTIHVLTSGRTVGRAPAGLADLLRELDDPITSPLPQRTSA